MHRSISFSGLPNGGRVVLVLGLGIAGLLASPSVPGLGFGLAAVAGQDRESKEMGQQPPNSSLERAGQRRRGVGAVWATAAVEAPEGQRAQGQQQPGGAAVGQVLTGGQRPRSEADVEYLAGRLEEVASLPGAATAAGRAIARAGRALQSARRLQRAGDIPGAERARHKAEAALCLASRQIALEHARQALRAAKRRAAAAETAAKRAREALAASLRRRAALRMEAP